MIERLLAADAAVERGELEVAERLFGQVAEADARNAIAVVGLARIAAARGDTAAAGTWVRRALEIDPEEAAARRLMVELDTAVDSEVVPEPVPAPVPPVVPPAPPPQPRRPSLLDRLRRLFRRRR